jgi:hypothetical protein
MYEVINCYHRKTKQQQYNFNVATINKSALHMALLNNLTKKEEGKSTEDEKLAKMVYYIVYKLKY